MDVLLDISATFRLVLTFGILVMLMCSNLSLGHIFLVGVAVLAILFGLSPVSTARAILQSVCAPKTLALIFIVSLIIVFSKAMEISGQMNRISLGIQNVLPGNKINLIFFPALIGLLPMPGGAVFSAPMVKEIGEKLNMTPARMCFANYWFRHVWEYWWPTYPAVILILYLAELKLFHFALTMLPLSIFALYIGVLSMRETETISFERDHHWSVIAFKQISKDIAPIFIIIGIGLPSGLLISQALPAFTLSAELGLIGAVVPSIAWIFYVNNMSRAKGIAIWANPQLIKTAYMIAAIFAFKEVLQQSHAVQAVGAELMNAGIPMIWVVITLPFLAGLATGLTIGFVGATLPIVLSLVQASALPSLLPAYLMLAVTSGFVGVLVSPLHLCFTLNGKYFDISMSAMYRNLWLPVITLFGLGIVYFWLLMWWIGL